jgi:hypothetical protein
MRIEVVNGVSIRVEENRKHKTTNTPLVCCIPIFGRINIIHLKWSGIWHECNTRIKVSHL